MVMRRFGTTTVFGDLGPTEIFFPAGLPDGLEFRLAPHEGSEVGMAAGRAIARERPAFVNQVGWSTVAMARSPWW